VVSILKAIDPHLKIIMTSGRNDLELEEDVLDKAQVKVNHDLNVAREVYRQQVRNVGKSSLLNAIARQQARH
jgi:ribosome biogenesis GTPase A